jgi:hypothetical protein
MDFEIDLIDRRIGISFDDGENRWLRVDAKNQLLGGVALRGSGLVEVVENWVGDPFVDRSSDRCQIAEIDGGAVSVFEPSDGLTEVSRVGDPIPESDHPIHPLLEDFDPRVLDIGQEQSGFQGLDQAEELGSLAVCRFRFSLVFVGLFHGEEVWIEP